MGKRGRSPRARQPLGRWQVVFLVGLVVLGCLLYVSQYVGPAGEIRAQKFALIRAEFTQITLFSGSTVQGELVKDQAFVPPSIANEYTLPGGQCVNAQNYYQVELALDGWSVPGPVTDDHGNVLITVAPGGGSEGGASRFMTANYQKRQAGYEVKLIVDCYVDQSLSPGYEIGIEAD